MAIPFVFNETPNDLLQINMTGGVGLGGVNARSDVTLVQNLLNAVPQAMRPDTPMLKVDGLCGPMTIGAIRSFQRKHGRIVDGRIDPGRATIKALVPLLRRTGTLPPNLPGIGRPTPQVTSALQGMQVRAAPSLALPSMKTRWSLAGSGSAGLSIGMFGVTGGDILIASDDAPGRVRRLRFGGAAVGLSLLPIGFDIGFESMPSMGSRIYGAGQNTYHDINAFKGGTQILSVEANMGPGVAFTSNQFFGLGSYAVGVMMGMQVGLPGAAITMILGAVTSTS